MDDLVTVTERDINEMILLMLEKHKLVIEAAGAVSLAALEHLNLRSRKFASATGPHVVVPIMSGGNIDTVTMGAVIQKGMIARGRIMNFEVELPDTPGQLVKVATLLAEQRANVIQLDHDQFKHPATTPTRCLSASRSRPTAPSTSTASSRHSGKPDSSPSASTDSNTAGGKPRRSVLQYLPLAGGGAKAPVGGNRQSSVA